MKNLYIALDGGIGNQLFQYAFAKAVAQRFSYKLKLYTDAIFERDAHGSACITDIFDLEEARASFSEVRALSHHGVYKELRRLFGATAWTRHFLLNTYIESGKVSIDEYARKQKNGFLISGYFQSEDFFYDYRSALKRTLQFKAGFSELIKKIEIPNNAIYVHVRRGDYVKNSKNKSIYHELDANYYGQAIALQYSSLGDAPLVVFSDDLDYAHRLIRPFGDIFLVEKGEFTAAADLALMARGKRFVVANSTFSWWGAWLAEKDGCLVIAPKNWYCHQSSQKITPDRWPKV